MGGAPLLKLIFEFNTFTFGHWCYKLGSASHQSLRKTLIFYNVRVAPVLYFLVDG